jgi:hypothetical protein
MLASDVDGDDLLEFPTLGSSVNVIRTRHGGSFTPQGTCVTSEFTPSRKCIEIRRSGSEALAEVRFGVLNFMPFLSKPAHQSATERAASGNSKPENLYEVTLASGAWEVRVRSLPETKELLEEAQASGGFAVSHAGRLTRADGGTFSAEEGDRLLHALSMFLSFSRGLWSPAVLPHGIVGTGAVVWEQWGSRFASSWSSVYHWVDEHQVEWLRDAFPGFMHAWDDAERREAIKAILYWYIAANQSSSGVDVCLILSQAALEHLAWSHCVIGKRLVSPEGFKALRASDRLRMALSSSGIPIDIPPELKELSSLASRLRWLDGPQAVTEIRNELVHPEKRGKAPLTSGLVDAWMLAQQYVELLVLHSIDYRGNFSDRIRHSHVGQFSAVPWAR